MGTDFFRDREEPVVCEINFSVSCWLNVGDGATKRDVGRGVTVGLLISLSYSGASSPVSLGEVCATRLFARSSRPLRREATTVTDKRPAKFSWMPAPIIIWAFSHCRLICSMM